MYFSPPPTVVDIHSVESVYSKKDVQDSHMHHLLEDALFRPRKMVSLCFVASLLYCKWFVYVPFIATTYTQFS